MYSWLVECDMAILANTTQEELDTATMLHAGLIHVTFRDQVFGISIQQVHLGGGDIDCVSTISTGSIGGQIRRIVREKLAEYKSVYSRIQTNCEGCRRTHP